VLDFSKFITLSFDCYGTLIDWETGILGGLRPVLAAHKYDLDDEAALSLYAELETAAEAGPYRRYREVLQRVMDGFASHCGFDLQRKERQSLVDSFAYWAPFPDTVEALLRLAQRYRLVILSNVDDDLFALTRRRLPVDFYRVLTAQQIGSYKPARGNFERLINEVGSAGEILHVAQSLFHDIAPARSLGLKTVWVNRRGVKASDTETNVFGATPAASAQPDLEVPDLETLANLMGE
jgi:2-haloacid dehalogenase